MDKSGDRRSCPTCAIAGRKIPATSGLSMLFFYDDSPLSLRGGAAHVPLPPLENKMNRVFDIQAGKIRRNGDREPGTDGAIIPAKPTEKTLRKGCTTNT